MDNSSNVEYGDLQGLLRFGYGKLTDTCFMLLNIADVNVAKQWLTSAPVSSAVAADPHPDTAMQIAFSVNGLRSLGLNESIIEEFSDEFVSGMSGDKSRSRRLGDVAANAPEHWQWGGDAAQTPHILVLLYSKKGGMESWRKSVEGKRFSQAFQLLFHLPTSDIGPIEPFGFMDGISQPEIDWACRQSTDSHRRANFSNLLAPGEVALGYPNEYGLYTARPLVDPNLDGSASELLDAEDEPTLKDFARNGSYLVLRQLAQDVPGFWQFIDKVAGSHPEQRDLIAASMVGRDRKGSPLASVSDENIAGVSKRINRFTYDQDSAGRRCPIGAHIRRSNPRTGDLPAGVTGLLSRLVSILGFGQRPEADLVASTRFHRLLRRGRTYGPLLTPQDAVKADAPVAERGLQFISLAANILRQFEFVQNAWAMSSKFSGLERESDPLLGNREALMNGGSTDQFIRTGSDGSKQTLGKLPQFVTVRGGGYFFMPGLRALKYMASFNCEKQRETSTNDQAAADPMAVAE